MSKRFKVWLLCLCGLLVLGLALFTAPAPHALAAAHFPASGGDFNCVNEYAVSFDADTYSLVYTDAQDLPAFSIGAFDPLIGAEVCADQKDFENHSWVYMYFTGLPPGQQGWYTILTTVAGTTTQTTLDSSLVRSAINGSPSNLYAVFYTNYSSYFSAFQPLQVRQPYSVQVQYCQNSSQGPSCSLWSPHLQFTVYANNGCLSGYVPRLANPYDQVCVTPAEQAQVAYDNSQIENRLDTGTVSGEVRCLRGYVWRGAFGGDMACVTLAQRSQVAQDNSLASTRIIAP